MVEEKDEGLVLEDGTEGSTTGFRTFGGGKAAEAESPRLQKAGTVAKEEEEPEEDFSEEEEPEEEEWEEEEEEEEGLFDEEKIPEELKGMAKQLQRTFTERMKGIGAMRLKANLVDAIERDPEGTILALADRYGIDFGGGNAPEEDEGGDFEFEAPKVADLSPKKDEQMPDYIQRVIAESLKSAIPQLVKGMQKGMPKAPTATNRDSEAFIRSEIDATLRHLDETYPDWGIYEDRMAELVTKHPTLRNDPDELYRLAKSSRGASREQAKATRTRAKAKTAKKGKVRSGERGGKPVVTTQKGKKLSFNEAWDRAKRDALGG